MCIFPLNEVRVSVDTAYAAVGESAQLLMRFSTETPAFDGFVIDVSGIQQPVVTRDHDLMWSLPADGSAQLTIRARNSAGKHGSLTTIVARVSTDGDSQ